MANPDVPQHFICPITCEIMKDPVIDNDGVSYEREAITEWLAKGNTTSPATQKYLGMSDLRPNRALREAIEQHLGIESTVPAPSVPTATETFPAVPVEIISTGTSSVSEVDLVLDIIYDGDNMMASINPPDGTRVVHSSICCVVDVSGSMDSEATVQDENGKEEQYGLSVLDITKHALKTIVKSMTPNDEFSLITFSSDVTVVMEPRMMTPEGVTTALHKVEGLRTEGMTNLWAGLKKGLELLTDHKPKTNNVALFLLTDGLPNVSPGVGEAKSLQNLKANRKGLPCRINTFGFGYSMDSKMLNDLATIGGGAYAFIPDSSFVGTVFVNAVANHITTAAHTLTLSVSCKHVKISDGDHSVYGGTCKANEVDFQFGSIQFGQSKNVVFPIKPAKSSKQPPLEVSLSYYTGDSKKTASLAYDWSNVVEGNRDIKYHRVRLALVKAIKDSLTECSFNFQHGGPTTKKLDKGQKILQSAEKNIMLLSDKGDERSNDILKDLTGQISEAFSKEEYLTKWGLHFCLSIKLAHLYQFCNNFKDPGVQHYCSELFSETRDKLDNIFISLPAPTPSRPRHTGGGGGGAAPRAVNMARFMNVRGGCFLGSSKVHLPGQNFARADGLKKGDKVITGEGTIDEVECVMKTILDADEPTEICVMNDSLAATPWHPIKNEEGEWVFPAQIGADAVSMHIDAVYSFLLKSRGTLLIGDFACATLAHGIQGKVIGHEFLGEECVARDLKQFESYYSGIVQVTPECFKRDRNTGRIVAIKGL